AQAGGRVPVPLKSDFLSMGSYYHRPNAEGLDWFIQRVWPQVRRAVPEAEFRVIGPGLPAGRGAAYARVPGITVLGVVPDVVSQYRECAFTIAPIWTGAGINIKVFESYAFGRTSVLTPFAHRGYEDCLEDGISVCVAKSPEEYAQACVNLLRNPARRDQLAAAGHPQIMRDFSFARFARVVDDTLMSLEKKPHLS
ncbi:MAG TPA: glycosyltransferase, partial [Kiritimatiellia bacterium]|nr:glycosyltransferase [Kiritimatiellia bacterium]